MKNFNLTVFTVSVMFCPLLLYAHSGRTDSSGGHYNRKTGGYHYHNSGPSRSYPKSSTSNALPPSRSYPKTSTSNSRPHSPSSTSYETWMALDKSVSDEATPPKMVAVQAKSVSITEKHWQAALNNKVLKGRLGATISSGTIDILTDTHVIEVDKASKYAKGIEQVVKYAEATGKKPLLALYIDGEQNGYESYQEAGQRCKEVGVSLVLINNYVSVDDLIASVEIAKPNDSEPERQGGVSDTPPLKSKNDDVPAQTTEQSLTKEFKELRAATEIAKRTHLPYLRAPSLARLDRCPVVRVIDGDTIVVSVDNKAVTVRMIGVDTPETVYPSKPVEIYGKEASRFTRNLLRGEEVFLVHDKQGDRTDRYGRTLAYVYRAPDRLFVNADIIRQGYGHAYTSFPFEYTEEFKQLQLFAQENKKGFWGDEVQEPLPLIAAQGNFEPETKVNKQSKLQGQQATAPSKYSQSAAQEQIPPTATGTTRKR